MKHQNFNGVYKVINYMLITLFLLLTVSVSRAEETKQEEKVTGSVSAGVYNRYVFRGYELSSGSVVIQPSITLSYKGFSVNYWGNIDTNERVTQSFIPDRPGRKSFNESDLTLSYTYTIDKLSLTGGYIYYGTKYTDETEEIFLSASYDVITKPTLTIYRDISTYPGTYINLSLSHSLPFYKALPLTFQHPLVILKAMTPIGKVMKVAQVITQGKNTVDFMMERFRQDLQSRLQRI